MNNNNSADVADVVAKQSGDRLKITERLINAIRLAGGQLQVTKGQLVVKNIPTHMTDAIREKESDIIWLIEFQLHESSYVSCTRCDMYERGECRAAGGDLHHAALGWKPKYPERLMRCYAYKPRKGVMDMRTGDERWPWLRGEFERTPKINPEPKDKNDNAKVKKR